MLSLYVFVVFSFLCNTPGILARPRDKNHKGLYDDVKIVPFVDEKIDEPDPGFGQNWNKIGNEDKSFDKYNKIYDLYHKQIDRTIVETEKQDSNGEGNDSTDSVDVSSLPVEGGVDDLNSPKKDQAGKRRHHRHGKSRAKRIHSHDLNNQDNTFEQNRNKENNVGPETSKKPIDNYQPEELSDDKVDLSKFFGEDPDFKKNVGVITDGHVDISSQKQTDSIDSDKGNIKHGDYLDNTWDVTKDQDQESVGDTSNELDKDIYDSIESDDDEEEYDDDEEEDDSDDDDEEEEEEVDDDEKGDAEKSNNPASETADLSSEMYNDAYDYYDGEEESSYSSSEAAVEDNYNSDSGDSKTPYDWFKEYDRMYSDQPSNKVIDNNTKENDIKKQTDVLDNSKTDSLSDTDHKPTTNTFFENLKKSINNIETADKTDGKKLINSDSTQEPSTSPNPPTAKKEWRSMVTQPANTEKKHNPDYVTYIESRPVEACDVEEDCPPGRYCKFGLCICGQPDLCAGHNKPVCGSDGTLYPSHCELHRTACVKGVHIRLASRWSCSQDKDSDDTDSDVDEGVTTAKEDTKTIDSLPQSSPKNVLDIEDVQNTDKQDTRTDIDVDNKVEVKDVPLSLVAADAVKSTVNLNDHSEESKDETVESQAEVKSFEYLDYADDDSYDYDDNDSVEKDSNESIDNVKKDTTIKDDSSDDSSDNTSSDSVEKENSLNVESEESKESLPPNSDHVQISNGEPESFEEETDEKPSLIPLFCTPDKYMEFKANVLQYHCLFFEEENCDRQTQKEKHKLAEVMFNYFDHNYNGRIEKEELWEMQLRESMDKISSLCTLLDIVTFDELGVKDGMLSPDEFIQAFDIPDMLEHRLEVVPLIATVGNGLEVKCDVTSSNDVIWRRNGMDLALLNFPGISVLGDGSLYIESVGAHLVGNVTCHDRNKPSVKQVHILNVQKPPHVIVSPVMSEHHQHANIEIHCHAEGLPRPVVEWQFNDEPVEQGEKYYIHTYDNTLTITEADYLQDSGVYKCIAHNQAGTAEAMATVTIHNPNDTVQDFYSDEESFIVFHDDGYTMHEPQQCLTQRHVKPEFGNFYFIPDELDEAPSMCESGVPCIWGSAVNVRERFVYVTQPRENRVLVIDVKDTLNPNQIIPTDRIPVALYYISHLDEVWVLCWNGEENGGGKTIVVIRDASKKTQHHTIHTQPIGNRFDLVQDIFLPPDNELHHPYRYGYTVHNGQQGLFKLDLEEKKYLKAVDFTMYQCVPKAMAFLPLGGHVLVKCVKGTSQDDKEILLQMDYITDIVISNKTVTGTPYISPDSRNLVIVDEHTGQIKVFTVKENGEISDEFDLTVGSPVNSATFHKASYNQGYDLYLTSVEAPVLFSISLLNGKIDVIRDIGDPDTDFFLPWFQKVRPLVSGDVFSNYLSTTATSRMIIFNGKHHSIECDYTNVNNPSVIAYTRLNNN